jgi:hypothetical protein
VSVVLTIITDDSLARAEKSVNYPLRPKHGETACRSPLGRVRVSGHSLEGSPSGCAWRLLETLTFLAFFLQWEVTRRRKRDAG